MNLLSTAFAFIFIAIVALASFWIKEEVINEYKNFTLSKTVGHHSSLKILIQLKRMKMEIYNLLFKLII